MSELSEWKLQVCCDLVKAVVPTDPLDAKGWADIAAWAEHEYKRDREKHRNGDPNFDLYDDNFIRKEYIFNRRHAIRSKLIRDDGAVLLWERGRGNTGIWRDDTEEALEAYLERRRAAIGGQAEGYNEQVATGSERHPGLAMPIFEEARLPSGTSG